MEWRQYALCKDMHIDLWYPPLEEKSPNDYYKISKAVCAHCPVWSSCIKNGKEEVWGCWGGTSPQDRKNEHRLAHGTQEKYRLGCRCPSCASAQESLPTIDLRKVPLNGESFDVQQLLFDVFTEH
jgi:hypothetical protein